MVASLPTERREIHHRVPRCLLKAWDRGNGPGLEPEDLATWCEWQEEAFRYGVDPEIGREELAALIEGSTVEIAGGEHRAVHSRSGDFACWGRLGGLETLALYGPGWFAMLAMRRWGQVTAGQLADYRVERLAVKSGPA
jgi:hypothetical protein